MINSDDSAFFVVFSMENTYEEIKTEIKNQLKIIQSHQSTGKTPPIIFVGTHIDQVAVEKKQITEELIKEDLLQGFSMETVCIKFVDARNSNSSEIIDLSKNMAATADQILKNMVRFSPVTFIVTDKP